MSPHTPYTSIWKLLFIARVGLGAPLCRLSGMGAIFKSMNEWMKKWIAATYSWWPSWGIGWTEAALSYRLSSSLYSIQCRQTPAKQQSEIYNALLVRASVNEQMGFLRVSKHVQNTEILLPSPLKRLREAGWVEAPSPLLRKPKEGFHLNQLTNF